MNTRSLTQPKPSLSAPVKTGLLQRKCISCGQHTIAGGECAECAKKKSGLQRKLAIGASNDPLEREADRVTDQVMAAPAHSAVSGTPPRIQRYAGQATESTDTAPASVDRVLASSGRPLETALQLDMEQRFGQDFSRVRVHSGAAAEQSARDVNANAYAAGHNIVFGRGQFAPGTHEGRRLLAHELTHVVQQMQADGGGNPAAPIQCDDSGFNPIPDPEDLVAMYFVEMRLSKRFDGIANRLLIAFSLHPSPYEYVVEVLRAAGSADEDQLGAAFVKKLPEPKLDQIAANRDGRSMLSILYEAIITGDVTEFEREQANRILLAKARQYRPEDYARMSKERLGQKGRPTLIFPIRYMRVTGGDYAPPLAKLTPDGKVRVKYPVSVKRMSMFKEEVKTLPDFFFFGEGEELNPNEIVGIKDYEKGGKVDVQYLPALALIDYSNRAIESTTGKIIEVSAFAATMGLGGGAVAGGRAAANEMVTSTAIWGARLAKAAHVLDRAANVIGIASFVISENREWIIKLGWPGKRLVQLSDIASSAAAIYGIGRLGQAGYTIVKDMRAASKAARAEAKALSEAEAATLQRLDDETDTMLKQLDEEAAKSGRAAVPTPAEKPAVSGHVDDPAAAKGATKRAQELADEGLSANLTTFDGHEIKITKDGTIWICTDPCEIFATKYRSVLGKNTDLADELEKIKQIADPADKATAIKNLKLRADKAPITDWQYLPLDGTLHKGNVLRLQPDDWQHILEGHVKSTFDVSKRGTSKVSTVFKGTPAQYLEILDEAVKNKAVVRELNKGVSNIRLKLRGQEWILSVDPKDFAIKTFHATGPTNPKLFETIRPK